MKMKKENCEMKVSVPIRSILHRLDEKAFLLFKNPESNIRISNIKEFSFLLSVINVTSLRKAEEFIFIAHECISGYLMAINAATLGYFTFEWLVSPKPLYIIEMPQERKIMSIGSFLRKPKAESAVITENQVRRSAMIYGAFVDAVGLSISTEYVKGLLHLEINFGRVDFLREAFGNFYRAFEHAITAKILQKNKLSNELKEMQTVLSTYGVSKDIVDELRPLYKIRSEQTMHAQKKPVDVDIDDVFKMKSFIDLLLNKMSEKAYKEFVTKVE